MCAPSLQAMQIRGDLPPDWLEYFIVDSEVRIFEEQIKNGFLLSDGHSRESLSLTSRPITQSVVSHPSAREEPQHRSSRSESSTVNVEAIKEMLSGIKNGQVLTCEPHQVGRMTEVVPKPTVKWIDRVKAALPNESYAVFRLLSVDNEER